VLRSQAYRILAVDDSADNLFLLKTVLEAEGYDVEIAESGQAALAKLQSSPPDLVLLDFMMPEMNGYEVAALIRQDEQFRSLPILLVTAYGEEQVAAHGITKVDRFIRKPIDFDELLKQVEQLLPVQAAASMAISG
jgi:CheY-like chemotaxis protein